MGSGFVAVRQTGQRGGQEARQGGWKVWRQRVVRRAEVGVSRRSRHCSERSEVESVVRAQRTRLNRWSKQRTSERECESWRKTSKQSFLNVSRLRLPRLTTGQVGSSTPPNTLSALSTALPLSTKTTPATRTRHQFPPPVHFFPAHLRANSSEPDSEENRRTAA